MPSKQGKNAFDEIAHKYTVSPTFNGTTLVNTEVDIDIPRGYAIQIRKVRTRIQNLLNAAAGNSASRRLFGALVNDPDDATTTAYPDGESNDVIHDFDLSFTTTAGGVPDFVAGEMTQETNYEELGLDMPVVRKMNFNIDADGAAACGVLLTIFFRLVKVSDTEKLELMEIL